MWLRNTCKKYYISVLIGVYFVAVLWITLFSRIKRHFVALVLETGNNRIIDDVGPVNEVVFELTSNTAIKVYVIVYPGCDCDVVAAPVIYREG